MVPTDIFIYGASGHGKVIADNIRACGNKVAGWIDDNPLADAMTWEEFCILHPNALIALGIGDNGTRAIVAQKIRDKGYTLATIIHPSAILSPSVTVCEGSVIMPLALINADATIGQGCIINSGAIVEHDGHIGDFVHIAPHATLSGGVSVGDYTFIGMGTCVIQQRTLGHHTIIAAGSVVIGDIPSYVMVAGVPAILKKTLPQRSL
jgi:UDP-N-acetylbacillosamine N-acetyltransferase